MEGILSRCYHLLSDLPLSINHKNKIETSVERVVAP